MKLDKYIRPEVFPTPFCQGCGHGILMQAILRAIDELSLDIDKMVFVSGIGCAAWIPSPHFAADTLHTLHGRPIAYATGIKLFNPSLKVVIISGDGDLAAIGGNHLIHAARRNIELSVICANNSIYGMTGGQMAPTTLIGQKTATSPYGRDPKREGYPMKVCELLSSLEGVVYLERVAVSSPKNIIAAKKAIKKAFTNQIEGKGFSLVEVLSQCPVDWGMTPQNSIKWVEDVFVKAFPLGVYKDKK